MKNCKRTHGLPKWASAEAEKLIDEWFESDSKLDPVEYVLQNCTTEFKLEYNKIQREYGEIEREAEMIEAETGEKVCWG